MIAGFLVLFQGFIATVITLTNLIDAESNLNFTRHVITMDTTFPNGRAQRRAIHSPWVPPLVFGFIVTCELLIAILCTWGGIGLLRYKTGSKYNSAKQRAEFGLLTALFLWWACFRGVAGEWFAMWQSKQWNGLPDAHQLSTMALGVLIYLGIKK